jgi:hypothetical protein
MVKVLMGAGILSVELIGNASVKTGQIFVDLALT